MGRNPNRRPPRREADELTGGRAGAAIGSGVGSPTSGSSTSAVRPRSSAATARRLAAAYPLASCVALAARRAGALTWSGALGATLTGGTVWALAPPGASVVLLAFFASGSGLTRLPGAPDARDREGRTLAQVFANGGVAAAGALAYHASPGRAPLALIGGSLAAATADTWATEVGVRFGGEPRRITTLRRVPVGTDGAVSGAGLAASIAGACALGGLYASTLPIPSRRRIVAACALGGVAGSLLDSLLGAALQSPPGAGRGPLGNDAVNFLCTLGGGAVAALAARVGRDR